MPGTILVATSSLLDTELRILAVFDETRFPDDDEPSQYDLDIHAILDLPGSGHIATLNHLGDVRVFGASDIRRPGPVRSVRPLFTLEFVADVERAVVVGGQLVGSQPRSLRAGGVLVSEPLAHTRRRRSRATRDRRAAGAPRRGHGSRGVSVPG